MKKIMFFLTFVFLISSCSHDSSNSDSTELFRNIFNNTSWTDSDGVIYTFKTGKLFYWGDDAGSVYYAVGLYNNIEYDGCVYNTVNNLIDSYLINKTSNFSTQNAADGTSIGYLW